MGLFYCGAHRFDLFWAGQWSSWVTVAMGVVWPIWVGLICFEFYGGREGSELFILFDGVVYIILMSCT